ncbi:hypothetical protein HUJ05_000266 [Dendroctonus ponderosae]|nr:hypothetical protein HUJ05_000266 [Dendroctonus ponderosae]
MSGRPRTTSFAEGNKQPLNPPLGGMKISTAARPARVLCTTILRTDMLKISGSVRATYFPSHAV